MDQPYGLGIGPDGGLYVAEVGNHRISRVDVKSGKFTTVAGSLKEPYEVALDEAGNIYFCDRLAHTISRIDAKTKAVTVVAGTERRAMQETAVRRRPPSFANRTASCSPRTGSS